MATPWTTLALLLEEVEERIDSLTPTARKAHRFKRRPTKTRKLTPFAEMTGPTRIFECGRPEQVPFEDGLVSAWHGTNNRAPTYHVPIHVLYPRDDPTWRLAALDDADAIGADLLDNQGAAPSGVQNRWIETPPEFADNEKDDWTVMTLTLVAVLDVQ